MISMEHRIGSSMPAASRAGITTASSGTEMEPRLTAKLDFARPVANTASTAMVMNSGLGMGGEPTEGGNTHGGGGRMSMAETGDAQAGMADAGVESADAAAKTPHPL